MLAPKQRTGEGGWSPSLPAGASSEAAVGSSPSTCCTALEFTTRGAAEGTLMGYSARSGHGREVRRVGTRTTAGVARGAVGGHLACAQGHQGSGVDTVGRSEGATARTSRVGAARFKMGKPKRDANGICDKRTSKSDVEYGEWRAYRTLLCRGTGDNRGRRGSRR